MSLRQAAAMVAELRGASRARAEAEDEDEDDRRISPEAPILADDDELAPSIPE
jgi:hypothetical protein